MTEKAYEFYLLYVAIKLHFIQDKYDYFKMRGKTSANRKSFLKRNDRLFFFKASKRHSHKEFLNYLVSNMVEDPELWIGEICDDRGDEVYSAWKKRRESLTYQFKNDINEIEKEMNDKTFKQFFSPHEGQHPDILRLVLQKIICIETFVIIEDMLQLFNKWKGKIDDDVYYPDFHKRCIKYKSFMEYDKEKMLKLFKNKFLTNRA